MSFLRHPPPQNRLRGAGLSREPSFDSSYSEETREPPATSRVARNKTITINPNNSVNIEIKSNAKKAPVVPPSPAAAKKVGRSLKVIIKHTVPRPLGPRAGPFSRRNHAMT